MKPIEYYVYARKSTEDEERQVMSIEDQETEINDFAKREKIKIIEILKESKSAKDPGRKVFNEMLTKIYASKKPVGIIAWHPDRLARNSVDGGQIIYMIDIGKIAALKFPTFWFEPTPQGKFMLQVAFGQSKYYSDNLSENVKRGIKHKVRRGEYPTLAPKGYINNPKTRNLDVDVTEAKIIGKAFKEFAEGRHSLATISQRMALWGMHSKFGNPLCKASVLRILTNPLYLGLIHMHGEIHEGKFDPIVDKTTFEKVQVELKSKSKPRKQKPEHNFPFTGLIKCKECGGMISAQYAKKGKYIYYRCSKRMGVKCSQPYIQDVFLLNLLREEISKVVLPTGWADLALDFLEQRQREDIELGKTFYQNLESQLKETSGKLDKLINSFLDGFIEQEDYLSRKAELLKTKIDLQEKIKNFGKRGVAWFELAREFLKALRDAEKLAFSEDLFEIKSFLKKFGSNRLLDNKKVVLDFVEPFGIASKYRALAGGVVGGQKKDGTQKMSAVLCCRDLANDILTYYMSIKS